MKKTVLLLLCAALVLFAGCKKSQFHYSGPVRFKITTQTPATKSAYSGDILDGKERIDWIPGDKIAIFMASGETSLDPPEEYSILDYTVGDISTSGVRSIASVSPVGEAHEWGDGDKYYTFAALYPSPSVDDTWENEIDLYNLMLTYPAVQVLTPKGDSGADALTLLPDMKYAYMFAFPIAPVQSSVGEVSLSLSPVFTAFEISIGAGDNDEVNLSQFRLVSNRDDQPLARVMNLYTDESHDESLSVSVDLTGIKLVRNGAPLTLTVFAYADGYSELSLEFTGTEIGTRRLDLKKDGEWIGFGATYKHRISGLSFPALDEGGAEGQGINWNGSVSEDIYWHGAEGENIEWDGNRPLVLPGEYSISATQRVKFSRGNLIYKGGKWDMHKQQYYRCFKENGPVTLNESATFDLFSWATAGIGPADATMKNYQPWSYNVTEISGQEATNPYGFGPSLDNVPSQGSWDAYAQYCDWGNNPDLQASLGAGWFTMSAYEWEYIFKDREASTVNGVEHARYAKAKVHGLPGMLIFSDDFGTTYTGDQSVFAAVNINSDSKTESDYSFITLTDKQWHFIEEAGAVFLAPTGAILDVGGPYVFVSDGDMYINVYWSSTSAGEKNASVFGCEGPETITTEDGSLERCNGVAVRLVRLAE